MPAQHLIPLVAFPLTLGACERRAPGADQPAAGAPSATTLQQDPAPRIALETTRGRIVIELDRRRAPRTVANILAHVEAHFYDGVVFHRVIPRFMIQTGVLTTDGMERTSSAPPLPNEALNGLRNVRGAVAMARLPDPHSATTQFFINLADNPRLDYRAPTPEGWGYAVFGRVVSGMDVVDAIAGARTTRRGSYADIPVEPVVIQRAYLVPADSTGR